MSELKVYHCNEWHNEYTEFYLKSEADKVIADLEESHKMEVEQLLLTILELKEKLAAPQLVMRLNKPEALYSDLETMGRLSHKIHVVERRELHQKYKRCLALSQEWRSYATFCGMQSSYHNNRGFGKTAEHYTRKEIHAWKCVKRWLKIAEKFKEAK